MNIEDLTFEIIKFTIPDLSDYSVQCLTDKFFETEDFVGTVIEWVCNDLDESSLELKKNEFFEFKNW